MGFSFWAILKVLLTPNVGYEAVDDIPLESLFSQGYRTILLDVDNTLVPYEQTLVSLQKVQWIFRAKSQGFTLFLVSNNSNHRRITKVADQLELSGLYFSMKPFTHSVRELAKDHQIDLTKTIFVGDQIFTDVVIGNWLRCYTVLVDPLDRRVSFFRMLQRDLELIILKWMHVKAD